MRPGRPIMIPVLRLAGGIMCVAAAVFLLFAFWADRLEALIVLLAAAGGVVGLTLLGFATNLVILHDIRCHLRSDRET